MSINASITAPRRMRSWAVALILAALVPVWSSAAGVGECLQLGDEFSALEAPGNTGTVHFARIELLKADPNATLAQCGRHGMENLAITIEEGQRLELRVLVEHAADEQASLNWEAAGNDTGWLALAASESPFPGLSAINLTIDGRGRTGSVSSTVTLRIEGRSQFTDHEIGLRVEFDEETPLFRNRFEVEPLPGQFSQRSPAPHRYASITLAALP